MRLRTFLTALALGSAFALSTFSSQAQAQTKKPQTSEQRDAKASKQSPAKKETPSKKEAAKTDAKGKASSDKGQVKKAEAKAAEPKKADTKTAEAKKSESTKSAKASGTQRPQRTASTQPSGKSGKSSGKKGKANAKNAKKEKPPCFQPPVEFARGFQKTEVESFSLTYCDGKPAPNAVELLSVLARPHGVAKPKNWPPPPPKEDASKSKTAKAAKNAKGKKGKTEKAENAKPTTENELPPGLRLLDEGLVTRLQKVVDHFGKRRIFIVSGYRPKSEKSYHQKAKALDFRLEGVKNEDLVAFCRTLKDTGCGYYPNSSFVHMDVRPPKTGHVYWIDASGPGEPPRYVSSWPPPPEEASARKVAAKSAPKGEDAEDESDLPSLMEAFGSDLAEPADAVAPGSEVNTL